MGTLATIKEALGLAPYTFDEETLAEICELPPGGLIQFFTDAAEAYGTEEHKLLAQAALHPTDMIADMESPAVALQDLSAPPESIEDMAEVTLSEDREPLLERLLHWIATQVVVDKPPSFAMDERGKYLIPLKKEGILFTLAVYPVTWHDRLEQQYMEGGWAIA